MTSRLRTTAAAYAAPTTALLVGVLLSLGVVSATSTMTEQRRHQQRHEDLRVAAQQLLTRLEQGPVLLADVESGAATDLDTDLEALLADLSGGQEVGLAIEQRGSTLAHTVGRLQLQPVGRVPLAGTDQLELVALVPAGHGDNALPVAAGSVGLTTTVLLSAGLGVWSLQGRRRRAVEQDLAHTYRASRHDALTGLANRPHLMEWLGTKVAECQHLDRSLGLVFIDVDRFKTVNDAMGHAVGDDLLKEVARRLGAAVRAGDLVARLAGDEFVVVFPGVADSEKLAELAERMQQGFDAPIELRTGPLYASLSMGLAIGDRHTASVDALLEQADAAMYVAKSTPGKRWAFFDERLRAEADTRQVIGDALRAGLEAGELILHYQPVVAMSSGQVVAVEAFVRWNRPGHGVQLPGSFLGVAEASGLIGAIGRMVVLTACHQAALWNALPAAGAPLPVAVNVSERQLLAPDFVAVVAAALEQSGVAPNLLHVEVSEAVAADARVRSSGVLDDLLRLGVGLVIDDFGLRHGSLGVLKELPLAAVKIHGSAVTDVADDQSDQAMVEAVVNLAGVLGALVVAESVETTEQLATLRRLGVGNVQGHLFMEPSPAEALSDLAWTRHLELRHGTGMVVTAGVARPDA